MDAIFERRIIMENNPLAFMHYRIGMERRPPDEKKEE